MSSKKRKAARQDDRDKEIAELKRQIKEFQQSAKEQSEKSPSTPASVRKTTPLSGKRKRGTPLTPVGIDSKDKEEKDDEHKEYDAASMTLWIRNSLADIVIESVKEQSAPQMNSQAWRTAWPKLGAQIEKVPSQHRALAMKTVSEKLDTI
jgi:hypothetical protein